MCRSPNPFTKGTQKASVTKMDTSAALPGFRGLQEGLKIELRYKSLQLLWRRPRTNQGCNNRAS